MRKNTMQSFYVATFHLNHIQSTLFISFIFSSQCWYLTCYQFLPFKFKFDTVYIFIFSTFQKKYIYSYLFNFLLTYSNYFVIIFVALQTTLSQLYFAILLQNSNYQMELDLEAKEEFEQKFKVISLLGRGSFGSVYECQDKADSQVYAVKVISKTNVKRSKIDCLREEAKLLSTIDHPNIVKVYEFVQTNTFIYLKMELIKNGTLQKLIKKRWEDGRKFTDEQIASVMAAIFRGLNHIHTVSIIHRDIKPDNILLPNEEKLNGLKIADFGLSTKLDFHYPKTATSKCGTMLYMAPQILCNYTYTKSVDVWSCAIIMQMLGHGKHPLYEPKMSTQDYKRKIKNIKFSTFTNKLAQDFFVKISKVQANERYTTQEALRHPWITRNFEDQIPLSLHESFSGFEKSHEISHMIKTFLTLRQIVRNNQQSKIPESYLAKKQYFVKQNYSSLTKSKSKQSARDINSLSGINYSLKDKQPKERNTKISTEVDCNNPQIMKLNSIFNSLFGKRSKLQLKTYTQGMITGSFPLKENTAELPDITQFKERVQLQIQRAVQEFKNNSKMGNRRILPNRQTPFHSDKYIPGKDDPKVNDKVGAMSYKIRYRKKNSCNLKLYE